MTIKQRSVLQTLAMYHGWYMSASERADPELYALIYPNKFVQCSHAIPNGGGLPSWGVTDLGRTIVTKLNSGAI